MAVYLGQPGALVALPDPEPGVTATLSRPSGVHALLGGGRVVDLAAVGRREWRLSWQRLTDDEYAVLEAFHSGSYGPGPWLLLTDDIGWNWLTPNQASGTDALGSVEGFFRQGDADETVESVADAAVQGRRCLRWTLPFPTTSGFVRLGQPYGTPTRPGVPAMPGVVYTFAVSACSDLPVGATANIAWVDAEGEYLPNLVRTPLTTLGPAYQRLVVTLPPAPPGAQIVYTSISVDNDTVTAPTLVHLDALSLTVGHTVPPWRPGRGIPRVTIAELTDRYPWTDAHDCDMTLLEVG